MSARPPIGRPDLFYQEVRDGGVLFDADGQKVYVLNPSAAFVWNCCDGTRTAEAIAADLAEALGPGAPDRATLATDVARSLEDFRRHGLLAP